MCELCIAGEVLIDALFLFLRRSLAQRVHNAGNIFHWILHHYCEEMQDRDIGEYAHSVRLMLTIRIWWDPIVVRVSFTCFFTCQTRPAVMSFDDFASASPEITQWQNVSMFL